jgi:molecular chaperone GrpE
MTRDDAAKQGPGVPGPAAASEPDGISEADLESAEAELLEADLRELAAERDEFRGTAQRIQADFENYRKRVARDQTALVDRATERLIEAILPSLDGLEMAVVSLRSADDQVRKGVELAVGELTGALERHGLTRIAEPGVPFDPTLHEAVMHDEGEGDPIVGAVLRTGYALNGRVVRPAMVKVTRSEVEADAKSSEEASG